MGHIARKQIPSDLPARRRLEAGELSALVILLILGFLSALPGQGWANTQRFLVEYRSSSAGSVDEDFEHLGAETKKSIADRNLVAVELNSEMLNALRFSPNVVSIETDHRRYPLAQTQPYGVGLVQASQLSADIPRKVCVIDSGYELDHPDLPDNDVAFRVTGESQVEGESWDIPGDSHGTHVAGTIAALDNSDGVIGVYPDQGLTLHIVKVFDNQGLWTHSSDLIAAVDSCVNAGAHVINMSLGGSGSSTAEAEIFAEALAENVLSIAAAGNSGSTDLSYPGSYDSVMSVAAVNELEELASFSTRNEQVEIAAPGVDVLSTITGNDYAAYSGTSMAAPHVAAGAALLWSNHASCTAEEIRHALNKTAKDLGSAGRDHSYGHGLLQIKSAHDAFVDAGGCDVGPIIPPEVFEAIRVEGLSGSLDEEDAYSFEVPPGASNLSVEISGGSGDADLYLRQGSPPTLNNYDCRPYYWGNEETCSVSEPAADSYYVMLHAYSAYSGVDLVASYTESGGGGVVVKLPATVEAVGARPGKQLRLIDETNDNSQNLSTFWNNWNSGGSEPTGWFTLDLGTAYSVTQVLIAPRANKPYQVKIYVGDDLSGGRVTGVAASECNPEQEASTKPTYLKTCQINEASGRYVTIQKGNAHGVARFYGVEIWGRAEGDDVDTKAPSVPENVAGNATGTTEISLTWDPASDLGGGSVAGYTIYRDGYEVGTTEATSYVDTGLAPSTSYDYAVSAYDDASPANESAQSSPSLEVVTLKDTAAPNVPENLTGSATASTEISLTWDASSDLGGGGIAGYRIYRNGVEIGVTTAPNYKDSGLAPGSYAYTVSAYDDADPANESAQSNPPVNVLLLADTTAPSVPENLSGTGTGTAQISLSWDPSSDLGGGGVEGYNIYRDGVGIGTATATSYNDSGLSPATAYAYTVSAYDDANPANESAQSSPPLTVWTQALPPELVVNPKSITETLAEGAVSVHSVDMANIGGQTLTYSISLVGRAVAESESSALPYVPKQHRIVRNIPKNVDFVPGELIVKLARNVSMSEAAGLLASVGARVTRHIAKLDLEIWELPGGDERLLLDSIAVLSSDSRVVFAEPNYIYRAAELPNDTNFSELWGLHNTGQTGGAVDADIDAPEAWEQFSGSSDVIVAVIDTGVDYTHEDLIGNMWSNTDETPDNGIDDDLNGYIDDIYGYDFAYGDSDPIDGDSHGTHCSGIIGATGGNAIGVAGVAHNVSIMAVKFLNDNGSGSTADAIDAIVYAVDNGANILNNSWGGGGYSSALEEAIAYANSHDVLFVAAAGNSAVDNDISPHYPSNYDVPNVVSVAATDHSDQLAGFSNWGQSSVDLGAPGVDILSSTPGDWYLSYSGTSMATPYVAGVAALLKGLNPGLGASELKQILLDSGDPVSALDGKTVTGQRLNAHTALSSAKPDWLEVSGGLTGAIEPGDSNAFTLNIDSTGLIAGTYGASILIDSNDPDLSQEEIPIELSVLYDSQAPASVDDLQATDSTSTEIGLQWTAVGEDGLQGRAHAYDIRYSTTVLTEESWATANTATGEPAPEDSGSVESMTLTDLLPNTAYWIALKVMDNSGQYSGLSNMVEMTTSGPPELNNSVPIENLSDALDGERVFFVEVPPGASNLSVEISGGSGDADLYLRQGSPPTLNNYDCRPYYWGNEETCSVSEPAADSYYVMLHAYSAYSGVDLVASYTESGGGGVVVKLPATVEAVGARPGKQLRLIDETNDNSQNLSTFWNNWNSGGSEPTGWFTLDLGTAYSVTQVLIAPRANKPYQVKIYVGDDLSGGRVTGVAASECNPEQEASTKPTYLKTCQINETSGRYVTIQKGNSHGVARFYGVEIWGS